MATRYPISVSNSEIQTFKECRRRWWFIYYRRLGPKNHTVVGPLALGSRVHDALEAYYTDHQDPLKVYATLLEKDRITLLMEERDLTELESEGELGRIMLEGYVEWIAETGADANWEVISAEKKISAPLMHGKVELMGKLDMRVRRLEDDVRLFVDHKTSGNFSDISRTAHMAEQFLMYHLLETLQPEEDQRCDGGVYNMLKKVKRTANARPPFYERLEVRHNKTQLRSFWARIHGVLSTIVSVREALDAGADHHVVAYPTPGRDCTWKCPFFPVCPLTDDGSAAEAMIEDLYIVTNPYERYSDA